VFLLLLGAGLGQGIDYWRTVSHIAGDIRGYVLNPNIHGDSVEIHLAFVNKGNRQGVIVNVQLAFPITFGPEGGTVYIAQRSVQTSASGVPVVLNPGDIRLITLKGKLDTDIVVAHAKPVEPLVDPEALNRDLRKQDLALQLQALDFRGRKYETFWRLGSLYSTGRWHEPYDFDSYRMLKKEDRTELRVFDSAGYSPGSWFTMEAIGGQEEHASGTAIPFLKDQSTSSGK
jgi:hypothetical protein